MIMAELQILRTERTIIKPFTKEDITPRYVAWLNDPDVVKYSQQRLKTQDHDSCYAFFKGFQNSNNHFSAVKTKSGEHIGNISTTIDQHNRVADIAILIGEKSLWGQGYGLEIWSAVMSALLNVENMRLVTGGSMATNKAMIKLMENAGMKPYYIRKAYFICDNEEIDSVHYVVGNKNGNQ